MAKNFNWCVRHELCGCDGLKFVTISIGKIAYMTILYGIVVCFWGLDRSSLYFVFFGVL